MTAVLDRTTTAPKRVLMVVANPATSTTTGRPVGFWASELLHPGRLITGRQQYSGRKVAALVIEAPGV